MEKCCFCKKDINMFEKHYVLSCHLFTYERIGKTTHSTHADNFLFCSEDCVDKFFIQHGHYILTKSYNR
jgi:hypothetical protein